MDSSIQTIAYQCNYRVFTVGNFLIVCLPVKELLDAVYHVFTVCSRMETFLLLCL